MKQLVLATLLAVSPLCGWATNYYTATFNLNVRTGAGTEYPVAFTLSIGNEVRVLSNENGWYKIEYGGKTGYAYSRYLSFSRSDAVATAASPLQVVNRLLVAAYVCLALLVGFIVYRKLRDRTLLHSVTSTRRGTKSERDLVLRLLKSGIPAERIFHDLYVEKRKGEFSQADLVVVTEPGIIVFEVKEYGGWIYGSGNHAHWTKVLAYGKQKYRFYNPIMQNDKHIAELKKYLAQFGSVPFYSVVVFYGDCVLKEIDVVPHGTFVVKSARVLDAVKTILNNNYSFSYPNETELLRRLRVAVNNGGNSAVQHQHQENIKDMLVKLRVLG